MNEDDAAVNAFYCMVCTRAFRTPLYSVTRSAEIMHFYEGSRLPEAEVICAESIGNYCCCNCLRDDLNRVLAEEGVLRTNPGPGPIEVCSTCGRPVDMTKPHSTWTQETATVLWSCDGPSEEYPTDASLLAVRCSECDARNAASADHVGITNGRNLN